MKIGIVGADSRAWSQHSAEDAQDRIKLILSMAQKLKSDFNAVADIYSAIPLAKPMVETVGDAELVMVSGHCPMGNELLWCHEEGRFFTEVEANSRFAGKGYQYTKVYNQGGVDSWAEIIADELGIKKEIYPAETNSWEHKVQLDGPPLKGYRDRNIQIAKASDVLYVLSPKSTTVCSRCRPEIKDNAYADPTWHHMRNGGCFTAQEAEKLDKPVVRIAI